MKTTEAGPVFVTLLLMAACGASEEEPLVEASLRIQALQPPVGEGSEWPHLSASPSAIYMSWLETSPGEPVTRLRLARLADGGWSDAATLTSSERFFVNWADFPSVVPLNDSVVMAHWLVRGAQGGYDYGIRVSGSVDGGRSWSEAWSPHDDGTPTEHGFVTILPMSDGEAGLVWLDGRDYATAQGEGQAEMAVRFRLAGPQGALGPEVELDPRTCDCCSTDAALTSTGPVVVYRDRSEEEIRDIAVSRRVDGRWSEPAVIHRDDWQISACPVNGPAVAASAERVVVAWFTAAQGDPRVLVAQSHDGGATFGQPVRVDDGSPFGRVDVEILADGGSAVSWLERSAGAGEIRLRFLTPAGQPGSSHVVGSSSGDRASGFPQMVSHPGGGLVIAWTEPAIPRVRAARVFMDGRGSAGGGDR